MPWTLLRGTEDAAARFFRNECAACHGTEGLAKSSSGTRLPGRVLADGAWLAKQEDEALTRSILDGKGAMPGYKGKLKPEEVRKLLGLIRSFVKAKRPGR